MKKWQGVVSMLFGLVLVFSSFVPVSACPTIYVKSSTLCDHEINGSEWHFVINQIDDESHAPASISVMWENGASESVLRASFSGKVAHYVTTSNLDSKVADASASIYDGWDGEFNLSHGPACVVPSDTPTNTPENTPTFTLTPTETDTPTNTPTFTLTPTDTNTPTNTPTFTLTPTDTNTPTNTPTFTLTPTETDTPTNTPTFTLTPTKTKKPTKTATPRIITVIVTETPTSTPRVITVVVTSTVTVTPVEQKTGSSSTPPVLMGWMLYPGIGLFLIGLLGVLFGKR